VSPASASFIVHQYGLVTTWPASVGDLVAAQTRLGLETPPAWLPGGGAIAIGGCFVCFARGPSGPGAEGDHGWAAAAVLHGAAIHATAVASGPAGAGYEAGLLALREGALLETAVRALPVLPDVLCVNATGRDHPRRAGLALHLGAILGLPTVGVTHRPLVAEGAWPPDERGSRSPLLVAGERVGYWVRTRRNTRPLAVTAGWRTDPDTAVEVVLAASRGTRTPAPLREARRLARTERARSCRR
jgi:deoxyribonuclease V